MHIKFEKYSANGNDFIIVDNRVPLFPEKEAVIAAMCLRRVGIGADGVVLIGESSIADFSMKIYNSDGSLPEMCGNATRCVVHFAHHVLKLKSEPDYSFETMNATYTGKIVDDQVVVAMSEHYDVNKYDLMGFRFPYKNSFYINTGVPHSVFQVDSVDLVDIIGHGRVVRQDPRFEKGTNVCFFEVLDEKNQKIRMRVYERGVEGETLCCGTGVMATALACRNFWGWKGEIKIHAVGGEVTAILEEDKMFYCGRVERIYSGVYSVEGSN